MLEPSGPNFAPHPTPQELLKLTDNELEEFFYLTLGSKFVEPDWPPIHILLQRRGVT